MCRLFFPLLIQLLIYWLVIAVCCMFVIFFTDVLCLVCCLLKIKEEENSLYLFSTTVRCHCQVTQTSGAVWKSRWPSWAPVPNKPTVSVDVKQHFNINQVTQTSGAVWKSRWPSWAPVPNKHVVSVDVKQHSSKKPNDTRLYKEPGILMCQVLSYTHSS